MKIEMMLPITDIVKPTANRIALMGGAYGNVPALRACIEDARAAKCDCYAFLGDAVGCCGHSRETLAELKSFDVLVAGNLERQVHAGADTCGCGYDDPEDERISCLGFQAAYDDLDEGDRAWLGTWPLLVRLQSSARRWLLCHGSPEDTSEFLYASRLQPERIQRWLARASADALICTHTGLHWLHPLSDGKLAVNCGAVGKPDHDGDRAVHYAILSTNGHGEPNAEIRRVDYDADAWSLQLEREGTDPVFIEPLRTGRWTTGVRSLPDEERGART